MDIRAQLWYTVGPEEGVWQEHRKGLEGQALGTDHVQTFSLESENMM